MKKILVVFTGGTIGSVVTDGTIDTTKNALFRLLELFHQHYPDPTAIHFDTLQPLQILSENLAAAAWQIIIEAIETAQPDNYDGIIVTHGTDTLAYSAAALSFYFHALQKPLLLVSSDYPLDNPKGNGLANFICAVEFIRQGIANGVFVPYRNTGQTMQVHRGSRLTCSLQLSGDFYSVQGKSYFQFDGQQFMPVELPLTDRNPTQDDSHKAFASQFIPLKAQFSGRILMIRPYPGLDYGHFDLNNVDAVLHDLYHSGTACVSGQWGQNHSLLAFLTHCHERNVPAYLAPAFKSENAYQSTHELMERGGVFIWNMSIEAAYVKLALAYGNFADIKKISDFLDIDLAYEHIRKRVMPK